VGLELGLLVFMERGFLVLVFTVGLADGATDAVGSYIGCSRHKKDIVSALVTTGQLIYSLIEA
jgi:hypothetical protein